MCPSVLLARLRKAAKEPLSEQNRHLTESFVRIARLNKKFNPLERNFQWLI